MAYGFNPFNPSYGAHRNTKEVWNNIVTKDKKFNISDDLKDFIRQLLNKDPSLRLGCKGSEEIKKHKYFSDVNWDDVLQKKIAPEFIPQLSGDQDTKYVDDDFLNMKVEIPEAPLSQTVKAKYGHVFDKFSYRSDSFQLEHLKDHDFTKYEEKEDKN